MGCGKEVAVVRPMTVTLPLPLPLLLLLLLLLLSVLLLSVLLLLKEAVDALEVLADELVEAVVFGSGLWSPRVAVVSAESLEVIPARLSSKSVSFDLIESGSNPFRCSCSSFRFNLDIRRLSSASCGVRCTRRSTIDEVALRSPRI
jgi:hypothetical protein